MHQEEVEAQLIKQELLQFTLIKNDYELSVKLERANLYITAAHLIDPYYLKGQFMFDALPDPFKTFLNIRNVYEYIKLKRAEDNITIIDYGMQIQFSMAAELVQRIEVIALERVLLTEIQVLERDSLKLRKELEQALNKNEKLQVDLDEANRLSIEGQIEREKMMIKLKKYQSCGCCKIFGWLLMFFGIFVCIVMGVEQMKKILFS